MKALRILIVLIIVGTGGYLKFVHKAEQVVDQSAAAEANEVPAEGAQVISADETPTGVALAWAKIRNAFTGGGKDKSELKTASRDLGRLGGHFRSAPESD